MESPDEDDENADLEAIQPSENVPEDDMNIVEPSAHQDLVDRLEQIKNLPITDSKSKKALWSQFLVVWSEILRIPLSEDRPCHQACIKALPKVFNRVNFYPLRRSAAVARESCFTCISLLDEVEVRTFIQLTKEQHALPENHIFNRHVYFILLIITHTVTFIPFATIEDQQTIENHTHTYNFLIEYIDKIMPYHIDINEKDPCGLGTVGRAILGVIWNTTDRTVLVPVLLKCNLAKINVQWLSQAYKLIDSCRRPLISITHNLARHDQGVEELNKYEAMKEIKRFQKIKLVKMDVRPLIASMAMALLSTPEELKHNQKGINVVLNQCLQLVIEAAKDKRYRSAGFHVSEPLGVLVKIFVVEERTVDYVLCHAETLPPSDMHSTIRLFISLLLKFANALKESDRLKQYTLIALLNIFWSISFQASYASDLIQNEEFLKTVQNFIQNEEGQEVLEQYKPRFMEGVKEASHGILYNLNVDPKSLMIVDKRNDDTNVVTPAGSLLNKPSIMISYCHADNDFCDHILSSLSQHRDTFEIWIDRTHCQGVEDLWESIALGMERAFLIVCLISDHYFESKSCRKEFIYATDSLKKRVLPVLIKRFEPKGWLGIRMTGIKYVRFREMFGSEQNKISELINTILSSIPSSNNTVGENSTIQALKHEIVTSTNNAFYLPPLQTKRETSVSHATRQSSTLSLRPLEQWTSSNGDIDTWFAYHHLSDELRDLFDFQTGEEMFDYARLMMKNREKQMDIYTRLYAKKYNGNDLPPHEFNRFTRALEKLLQDHPASLIKAEPSSSNESKTCTIL